MSELLGPGAGFRDAARLLDELGLGDEAGMLRAAADGAPGVWAVVDVRELRLVREMNYATGERPALDALAPEAAALYLRADLAEAAARARIHDTCRGRTVGELLDELAACRVDELRHEHGLEWRRTLRERLAPALELDAADGRIDEVVVGGAPPCDELVELIGWRPFIVVPLPPLPSGDGALVAEAVTRLSGERAVAHLDSTSTIQAVQPSMEELREPRRTGRTTRHLKRWARGEQTESESSSEDAE